MAKFYDELDDFLTKFIAEQKIFFTATAPANGRLNLSPKGMDTFRVLSSTQVSFMNLTGSGNETAAHLAENGRLTIMFCSFTEKPLILRLYGTGKAVHPRDEAWAELAPLFPESVGNRQVILMDIESIQSACGFAVPFYEYQGERDQLTRWTVNQGEEGIQTYWENRNQVSIDGQPTFLLEEAA
ncbi:MAG: pyridoxamine 5'-phosphate oxidase [Chloroflexi bacterium]|nr:MAG: pyridoxamine 5'-phosphate oxidase [Chloroflexota bacterium]